MNKIFQVVNEGLRSKLPDVLSTLLPGGKLQGCEYVCASLEGGAGTSCSTNTTTGKGSDFATGEAWGDIIALASKVWNVKQFEAAKRLAEQYTISENSHISQKQQPAQCVPILPIPDSAPKPPQAHHQHGKASKLWAYTDREGCILHYIARFDTAQGKVVLPLTYSKQGNITKWMWKSVPAPRPLYNLPSLTQNNKPVLIVEGEKTAHAAKTFFPSHTVTTWSGGAQAVHKADWSVLQGRTVIIWPDNDKAGYKAALDIAKILQKYQVEPRIVSLSTFIPEKWDLADAIPNHFDLAKALQEALPMDDFLRSLSKKETVDSSSPLQVEMEDLPIKSWPKFSWDACPGLLGDFVRLATRDSEADPVAVCITALVRFAAEVYAFGTHQKQQGRGPHVFVGETVHPPRLFAVICGNSSKARKGTSRYPVATLFSRDYCDASDARSWRVAMPAKESGGPLSTGEGLAFHVREESEEERNKQQKNNSHICLRDKDDKRLIIQDEEFASALSCIKREGNTLSMGIRCFWDSGDYAPLTKNNPITVKGAHINIITHITMQELALCMDEVQAVNGFGNRFLWICARRSKLVALPPRMPEAEIAFIQRELWRLIGRAQGRGQMHMSAHALDLWKSVYPELSKEHNGFAGSIINRAEAQTLRLSLVYALLDGQGQIDERHLQSALALWRYAQASALYIFKDKGADPLEGKILAALQGGALTSTQLHNALQRNVSNERLLPVLQQLESQQRIVITKVKGKGRPSTKIALAIPYEKRTVNEIYEKNEFNEISPL